MTDQMEVDCSRWPAPQEGENQDQLKIMLAGKPYQAVDAYLGRIREEMATKMFNFNQERSGEKRAKLLESMATLRHEEGQQSAYITTPFTFEYVSLELNMDENGNRKEALMIFLWVDREGDGADQMV